MDPDTLSEITSLVGAGSSVVSTVASIVAPPVNTGPNPYVVIGVIVFALWVLK